MALKKLQNDLQELVNPLDVEIKMVRWDKFDRKKVLQVIISHPKGIDVDLCALVSETIVETVDLYMIEEENFYLEVTSMGAEAPFDSFGELKAAVNSFVHIELKETIVGLQDIIIEGIVLPTDNTQSIILNYYEKTKMKQIEILETQIKFARHAVKL